MSLLRDVASGLAKMFLADVWLTVALLAVVATAAGLIHLAGAPPLAAGGVLLGGSVAVLVVALRHAARKLRD